MMDRQIKGLIAGKIDRQRQIDWYVNICTGWYVRVLNSQAKNINPMPKFK